MNKSFRNLPLLMLKAREKYMVNLRPILNRYGITEQQWRIIRALSEHQSLEQRELCEICLILSPSMTGILKRMVELNLVERIRMEDQRRIKISLTNKSIEMYDSIKEEIIQEYLNVEKKIGKESLAKLYEILDEFIETV